MLLQPSISQQSLNLIVDDKDEETNNKMQDILYQAEQYKEQKMVQDLADLIKSTKPFLSLIPKNKAAKLLSSLVNLFLDLEPGVSLGVHLCQDCINWAKEQRMTYLRRALEFKLLVLYFDRGMHTEALQVDTTLLMELKQFNDKDLLVEVKLLESRSFHALGNFRKSRASLTSARIIANSIYCHPKILALLDLQSGVLFASEQNFETAFSYFYEAFQSLDNLESPKALIALKYMLMSKLMLQTPEKMDNISSTKYSGRHIDAMKSLAQASYERFLGKFVETLKHFQHELQDDIIVKAHLEDLYDTIFAQNLCKIIEPYSKIEIEYIAKTINLPKKEVASKLCRMILDKQLNGFLIQGEEVLIVGDKA